MVEGRLAGIAAAISLGYGSGEADKQLMDAKKELEELRSGEMGEHIRKGLEKMADIKAQMTNGKWQITNDKWQITNDK